MPKSHTPGREHATDTHVIKGAGLARGPALVLGAILSFAGLVLFLHAGGTPTGGFPDADATGSKFLGFESNGWTAFFTTTAGAILLFAAAQHLLAKTLGLIVGIALAACVVLDLVDGPGVLGLAAANWAVDLGWAIAAGLLLLNVFAPRLRKEEPITTGRSDIARDDRPREVVPASPRHDGSHEHDPHHDGRETAHRGDDTTEASRRDDTATELPHRDGVATEPAHRDDVATELPRREGVGTEAPRSSTTGGPPAAGDGATPSAGASRTER